MQQDIIYPSFKTRLASTRYCTMFVPISDRQNTAMSTLAFFNGTCIAQVQENIHYSGPVTSLLSVLSTCITQTTKSRKDA